MRFKKYNIQEGIKNNLTDMVSNNHVPHAQMFLGSCGYGTLNTAISFAQYLNCENPEKGDSCGVCSSCLKYEKLVHPDLHFIFPISGGDNKNSDDFLDEWRKEVIENPFFSLEDWYSFIGSEKQGYIGVSETNNLIKKINLKTFEANYKVFIIWHAEFMNTQAANKVLKVLEEPPENTVFILIAESSDNIIPTIISRTQILKFPPVQSEEMSNYLRNQLSVAAEDVDYFVKFANGDINKAIKNLVSSERDILYLEKFKELMRLAYKPDIDAMIEWAENMSSLGKEPQKAFIDYSVNLLRNTFVKNVVAEDNIVYLAKSQIDFANLFSKFITEKNLPGIIEELNLVYEHILYNANARVLFTDLVIKMAVLFKK